MLMPEMLWCDEDLKSRSTAPCKVTNTTHYLFVPSSQPLIVNFVHNYPDPIKNMDAALQQIRDAYAQASADERQQIQAQLTDLRNDIFTDWEVLFSLAMGVSSLPHSTPKQYRKLSNITTASSL
jgi:hypothetical protein